MFTLESIADGLSLKWDGKPILEYQFQKEGYRTFIHPLRMPDSPVLTMDRATVVPVDHPHHQGLYVGWTKVNGVDFWGQPSPGAEPAGFGRIVHQSVESQSAGREQAQFATHNAWIDWEDVQHLTETRETTVYAPHDEFMALDIRTSLVSKDRGVRLDLKRGGPPGTMGILYSGLTIRLHDAMTPGELLTADGRTEIDDVFGSASRWCGFSGRHQEDGQVYGVTILDHPENPRYPSSWWVRNMKDFSLLQPGLCYHEPLDLDAGETLDLRYRIVLHKGPVRPDLIQEAGW